MNFTQARKLMLDNSINEKQILSITNRAWSFTDKSGANLLHYAALFLPAGMMLKVIKQAKACGYANKLSTKQDLLGNLPLHYSLASNFSALVAEELLFIGGEEKLLDLLLCENKSGSSVFYAGVSNVGIRFLKLIANQAQEWLHLLFVPGNEDYTPIQWLKNNDLLAQFISHPTSREGSQNSGHPRMFSMPRLTLCQAICQWSDEASIMALFIVILERRSAQHLLLTHPYSTEPCMHLLFNNSKINTSRLYKALIVLFTEYPEAGWSYLVTLNGPEQQNLLHKAVMAADLNTVKIIISLSGEHYQSLLTAETASNETPIQLVFKIISSAKGSQHDRLKQLYDFLNDMRNSRLAPTDDLFSIAKPACNITISEEGAVINISDREIRLSGKVGYVITGHLNAMRAHETITEHMQSVANNKGSLMSVLASWFIASEHPGIACTTLRILGVQGIFSQNNAAPGEVNNNCIAINDALHMEQSPIPNRIQASTFTYNKESWRGKRQAQQTTKAKRQKLTEAELLQQSDIVGTNADMLYLSKCYPKQEAPDAKPMNSNRW